MLRAARVVLATLTLMAIAPQPTFADPIPTPSPQKDKKKGVEVIEPTLVVGKIVSIDPKKFELELKVKGKTITVSYGRSKFYKHSVKKLSELPNGTPMHAFARKIRMTRSRIYLEQFVVLAAGQFTPVPYPETDPNKPHWNSGQLYWDAAGKVPYIDSLALHCGPEREVCLVEDARLQDMYEKNDKGEIKGKKIYVRLVGARSKVKVDGKKLEHFSALEVILPTRGIDRKEYGYLLDSQRLVKEKRAGKR